MMVARNVGIRGMGVTLTPEIVAQYPPGYPVMQYLAWQENLAAGIPECWSGTPIPTTDDWTQYPGAPETSPAYRARLAAFQLKCGIAPRLYYDPATGVQVTDPNAAINYPHVAPSFPNVVDPRTQDPAMSAGQPRPTGTGPAATAQPAQPGVMTALPGATPGNAVQYLLAQAQGMAAPIAAATGVSSTVLLLGAAAVAAYFLFGGKGRR
jgi:hypothetical protein